MTVHTTAPEVAPDAAPIPPTHARRLAWNTGISLTARGIALALSFVMIPFLIRSVGMELYGILGVTWMVLGHLGWMDLGFSAACTRFVSVSLARGDGTDAARWVVTSLIAQVVIGALGAVAIWLIAPALVRTLDVAPERAALVVLTLRAFALAVPLELVTRVLTGVLEATQRFGLISGLTLVGSFWTSGAYLVGIARGGDFGLIVFGLIAQRAVLLGATIVAVRHALPTLRLAALSGLEWRRRARGMLGFGGWVTVNSAIGPLLVYFDRWLIGAFLGAAALPFFTVPFNLVMQLMLVPITLSATLFPAFAALRTSGVRDQWERAREYYVRSHGYLIALLLPVVFVLFVWAPQLLQVWVGSDFVDHATTPLRLLLIGVTLGLLAPVSGALLQGAGRPDLLSRIYLAELPLNVIMMWFLVRNWGITGAAAGYAARTIIETGIIWWVVHGSFRWSWSRGVGGQLRGVTAGFAGLTLLAALLLRPSLSMPLLAAATLGALMAYAGWVHFRLLNGSDRAFFWGLVGRGKGA